MSDFASPGALIFLHERAAFLAVHGHTLATFDCRGAKTTRFADHTLWHADGCVTNNTTFVTNDQAAVVSFCKPADDADTTGAGAVHVSDVVTCVLVCAVLRCARVDVHRSPSQRHMHRAGGRVGRRCAAGCADGRDGRLLR